jgi:putative heme-binding domain-containing protein
MLAALLGKRTEVSGDEGIVHSLASIAGASGDQAQILLLLKSLAEMPVEAPVEAARGGLAGLCEGLGRAGRKIAGAAPMVPPIRRLLLRPDEETRRLTLHVAGALSLQNSPELTAVFTEAHDRVIDQQRSLEDRVAALSLLASAPLDRWATAAETLLEPQQPLDLQLAAVQALAPREEKQVPAMLLAGYRSHTPAVRSAVIAAIFQRSNRLGALLDAVEQGTVPISSIDAVRREQLLRNSTLSERAKGLFESQGGENGRQNVLAGYQQAIKLPRNTEQGRKLFQEHCQKCHKLGTDGFEVGPDLLTARTRADETLVADVMDPSNQITVGYDNYTVITVDGRIFTGVLSDETATSITLRREQAAADVILRKNIEEMEASQLSMMPENMEELITPQDLAHLLGFLRGAIGSAPSDVVVLFEDEPEFPAFLSEGNGQARTESADVFSGKIALAVSPPQRFSARLPGWQFPIRQNPGPGEYRYLRYAWKQHAGHGAMLELAAAGSWPPADVARHRYFAGRNTTGWSAVCIDETPPDDWTVVERDLWADFGDFTLTRLAPTAMGGDVLFDRIELQQVPFGVR